MLHFQFNYDGTWEANSSVGDDGSAFKWRIGVCDDGTFSVDDSDRELTGGKRDTFATFDLAKQFCKGAEKDIVAEAKQAT